MQALAQAVETAAVANRNEGGDSYEAMTASLQKAHMKASQMITRVYNRLTMAGFETDSVNSLS